MIIRDNATYMHIFPFENEPSEYDEKYESRLVFAGRLAIFKPSAAPAVRVQFYDLALTSEQIPQFIEALHSAAEILEELKKE